MIAILEEAVGGERDDAPFDHDEECRRRTIDLLESFGYVDAHEGASADGEQPDQLYLDGATTLGACKLNELRRELAESFARR
jgi:hypothetical protein